MSAQLTLDEATAPARAAVLRSVHTLVWGRRHEVVLDGDAGRVDAVLPAIPMAPGTDPCPRCEHAARCVAQGGLDSDGRPVPSGCLTATGWRRAEAEYARLAPTVRP